MSFAVSDISRFLAVIDSGRFLAVADSGRVAIVRILQLVKTINTSRPLSHGSTSYQPINRLVNTDCQREITSDSFVSRLCRKLINVYKTG